MVSPPNVVTVLGVGKFFLISSKSEMVGEIGLRPSSNWEATSLEAVLGSMMTKELGYISATEVNEEKRFRVYNGS